MFFLFFRVSRAVFLLNSACMGDESHPMTPASLEQVLFAQGHARAYVFLGAADVLSIKPSPATGIFQALLDSHFVAEEWVVREDGTHGKSKTYRRSE
jgi:hypothetical protein